VNRLPLLLLPGDVFANRRPDPVLQQIEDFGDGTVSANDCFRPVSRYFDRITRPEQIINALQRAMAVLTDPAECGPVTLALCQDVQAEAFDYPEGFFAERIWTLRRTRPSEDELDAAIAALRQAHKPLIIAGGGALYSGASATLARFADAHRIPVAETQAGKSSLPADHPLNMGGSALMAPRPQTLWPSRRMSSSRWEHACRISRPALGLCSRTTARLSSLSTRSFSMRPNTARFRSWATPTRG
jgi:3D-(3,5/4)-trihydroxycyclohexane-1,2-dione acylhydrolase (decyclizing)